MVSVFCKIGGQLLFTDVSCALLQKLQRNYCSIDCVKLHTMPARIRKCMVFGSSPNSSAHWFPRFGRGREGARGARHFVFVRAINSEPLHQASQINNPVEVAIPLEEREAVHICLLRDLLAWREDVRQQSVATEGQFALADGGPSSEELVQEIEWLLDDTVAAVSCLTEGVAIDPNDLDWIPCSWRELTVRSAFRNSNMLPVQSGAQKDAYTWSAGEVEHNHSFPAYGKALIKLRASLEHDLISMWKARLQQRVPFQYLVAAAHWRDLVLAVQPGVLIPRPETEQLIDLAEAALQNNPALLNYAWVDLGTGSGAIAIALARLLPCSTKVMAVDLSEVAIAVASANVRRCNLEDQICVVKGTWFAPLESLMGQLGGVVSNPPYIPSENLPSLQAEVGRHEPKEALDGGLGHGMDALRKICGNAAHALRPGGFLALETNGGGQAELVAQFLKELPNECFEEVSIVEDMAGIKRHVTAIRTSQTS